MGKGVCMRCMRKIVSILLALMLLTAWAATGDEALTMPDDLKIIKPSAFYGDTSLDRVVLPEGVEEIESKAFAGSTLSEINLPASLTFISRSAFDGPDKVHVEAQKGTYAYKWAVKYGYIEDESVYPESHHPYDPSSDITWRYVHPESAGALKVTFSKETEFEDYSDFLCITDAEGTETRYSGMGLAGKTILLPGDTFTMRLTSDSFLEYYGFEVTDVQAISREAYDAWIEEKTLYPFDTMVLDDGTLMIYKYLGSEADVVIPESINGVAVTRVRNYIFDDTSAIQSVTFPASLTYIDKYVFGYGEFDIEVHAEPGTYAYDWAVVNGYYDMEDGVSLILLQESENGELVFENGTYRLLHTSGSGSSIDFTIRASGEWTCTADVDWIEDIYTYEDSLYIYAMRNETGAEREATLTLTCGDESVPIVITQEPYLVSSLVGYEEDERLEYSAGSDIELEFEVPENAHGFEFYYCTFSYLEYRDYPVTRVADDRVKVTIPARDLEPSGQENGFALYVTDEYGNRYWTERYHFYVHDDAYPEWGYRLIRTEEGTEAVIMGYYGSAKNLQTIQEIHGYPVTAIEREAFEHNETIVNMTISPGVVTVGEDAFYGCSELVSITYADTVTDIGDYSVVNCPKLREVVLPKYITRLYDVFRRCDSLTTLEIPDGVISIGDCFSNCPALVAVYIPASVTNINEECFYNRNADLVIYGEAGSRAESYANENNITFVAGRLPE